MKKAFIIILLSICSISCDLDDNVNPDFSIDLVPILEVELPEKLKKDSIYDFKIRYLKPTNCHFFRGYDYNYKDKERIVAIVNTVINRESCTELKNDTLEIDLKIRIAQDDFYLFKFWQGKDINGENKFLIKKIPVISPQ